VLFGGLPNASQIGKFDIAVQYYSIASKVAFGSGWSPSGAASTTLNPGEGCYVKNPTTSPVTLTFIGEVPQGTQVNGPLSTTIGSLQQLSSIIPRDGSLGSLGFPAVAGDQIQRWDVPSQQFVIMSYNGSSWSPSIPAVRIGEPFFLQSGTTAARSWTETLSPCQPDVTLTSPAGGSTFAEPTTITLSATATADAGINKVEFFWGNILIGSGTLAGNSYSRSWNNVAAGTYSLTAHATDNNGMTIVSLPVSLTVTRSASAWAAAGSINTARFLNTATLLANGKVLIVGGFSSSSGYTTSVELYDPIAGTSTATASLPVPLGYHTATLLSNGKVLVAGGYNDSGDLGSAELYDPATATWTVTGSLHTVRSGHTATLLSDGKVLVAGGEETPTAEVYDPATGVWTVTGSMAGGRYYHTAALLANGKVLVAGGFSDVSGILSRAELYDPATGTWSTTGSLSTGREMHTMTTLANGKLLVAGGDASSGRLSSSELYDPATGIWTPTLGSMNYARNAHTATLLPTGKVLVAGGLGGNQTAELYDPATDTWTLGSPLITDRWGHTATLLPNGRVVVVGGANAVLVSNVELY
jgi:N-acetylneuraminic acid mutarotase